MTTIIACRKEGVIVTDSKCTGDEGLSFKTPKVRKGKGFLVGAAGDSSLTEVFMRKFPRVGKAETVEGAEFAGLALRPSQIVFYDEKYNPLIVDEDYYAIGSGAHAALAVITAALKKGEPVDAVFAVEVACEVDKANSGLPAVVYSLKGKR